MRITFQKKSSVGELKKKRPQVIRQLIRLLVVHGGKSFATSIYGSFCSVETGPIGLGQLALPASALLLLWWPANCRDPAKRHSKTSISRKPQDFIKGGGHNSMQEKQSQAHQQCNPMPAVTTTRAATLQGTAFIWLLLVVLLLLLLLLFFIQTYIAVLDRP